MLEAKAEAEDVGRETAEEALPTQAGFFFGATDYDEWYFQDLEHTVQQVEKLLANPKFADFEFYYHSSW